MHLAMSDKALSRLPELLPAELSQTQKKLYASGPQDAKVTSTGSNDVKSVEVKHQLAYLSLIKFLQISSDGGFAAIVLPIAAGNTHGSYDSYGLIIIMWYYMVLG